MSEILSTEVFGDVGDCAAAATSAGTLRTALDTAHTGLADDERAVRDWTGSAAAVFEQRIHESGTRTSELQSRVRAMEKALSDFSGELQAVRSTMSQIRTKAAGADLGLTAEGILRPDVPAEVPEDEVEAWNKIVEAWNTAVSEAGDARQKEDEAHEHLSSAIKTSTGDGWAENLLEKLGFAPPDFADGPGLAGWGLGLGSFALGGMATQLVYGRYGTFQPRINNKWSTARGMNAWQRGRYSFNSKHWHAKPNSSAIRGRWSSGGKWLGRAGGVVTGLTAGWSEWQATADDPSLSDAERAGQTGAMAVTTGAGAWAGAEAGAWVGGAIGTAICPGVGTVVGGVLGGVVGGALGAWAGSEVGDEIKGWVGDATEATSEAVGDFIGGAGDVASDVGDALSFWD